MSEEEKKEIIADLHIHSKYSRATSINLDLKSVSAYAKIKGLNLLGTGDFTHPKWFHELKSNLVEKEKGVYYYQDFPFIFTTEVSLIYTKGRGRRVHILILAPSIEIVEQINSYFASKGRLDYDGRPIFKITCPELTEDLMKISKDIEIIPAHAWTPWFGIFGSMSGFDSLKEAFEDKESCIHAIETGLSSDPEMNWKISELNNRTILSFSDAHSFWPWRLGREATIFETDKENINYNDILNAIRTNGIRATIEVDPAYGKYHYDGHRLCNFSCSPKQSKELNNTCPVCKKPLVIGVENRVNELADQETYVRVMKKTIKPYYKILPLHEILSIAHSSPISSKKIVPIYDSLIKRFGNEFNILLRAEKQDIAKIDLKSAELILQNRIGNIKVKPGYDGVYGEALLSETQKKLI